MKIAFILPSLANRGPIIFTQYLLSELIKSDIEIEVFYFDDSQKNTLDLGVKTTKINFSKRFDFSDFDIVHTTMARPDIYASRFVPKEKWVCSMHNYLREDMRMLYNPFKAIAIIFLWKTALKKCRNIITSSTQMTEYYQHLFGKKINYSMIPYGIYEKGYSEIEKNDLSVISEFKKRGLTIIGSVGLLIQRKGFSQLFEILKKYDDTALVIIGEGKERFELEKIARENNLSDRFFLPGFRNNSHNYYQYFDIYAHVSYSEGFGLAMLEAMSKKLPVICSDLPIYKDFFTKDDVALFETGNSSSLISVYKEIKEDRKKYSEVSYQLFREQFDARVMASRHIELYQKLVKDFSEENN